MIYINDDQKTVLQFINTEIDRGASFESIGRKLYEMGYTLRCERNGRYISKTSNLVCKNNKSTFVYLIKRKNGLATWATINIF